MSLIAAIQREARFTFRDRAVLAWALVVLALSVTSLWAGVAEVRQQESRIQALLQLDQQERQLVLAKQSDYGSAAYYSFHLTYDAPSDYAFAALGLRDEIPWKHRVRMLALEGQIYERDAGNPVLALIGRLDFAFLAAMILPLIIIMLLHDLHSGERTAGRFNLLLATADKPGQLWFSRALIRVGLLWASLVLPLVAVSIFTGAGLVTLVFIVIALTAYVGFWLLVSYWLATWRQSTPTILAASIGVWMLLSVVIPLGGRVLIDQAVPLPSGASILMTQREAVNDAWDLPESETYAAFIAEHPQWQDYTQNVGDGFQWKWYYAFQQVGDQKTQALSQAYHQGRVLRDKLASRLAWVSPPALLERALQALAKTDLAAAMTYEQKVRAFHGQLRAFYYPKLFLAQPYEMTAFEALPEYQ